MYGSGIHGLRSSRKRSFYYNWNTRISLVDEGKQTKCSGARILLESRVLSRRNSMGLGKIFLNIFLNIKHYFQAIMIRNVNSEDSADDSHGIEVMTIAELSERYLGGPIYDPICQNAGLGPWEDISKNWSAWQTKLGCHFPAHDDNKLRFSPRTDKNQLVNLENIIFKYCAIRLLSINYFFLNIHRNPYTMAHSTSNLVQCLKP